MSNNTEKRRTIFINKAFQGRFILNVILVLLLSALCSALVIYWLTGGDLQAESHTAHANIANSLDNLGLSILFGNLVAMLVAGGLALFIVLYASHKIAGPLYRFEKLCQQIGDGDLDGITSLREGDQLQELGTAFSDMATKLRNRRSQRRELINRLNGHLDRLQQDNLDATQLELLAQVRQSLAELEN